jgi:hypothetical protein
MSTKYIINNEDGLITTGQIINGGISATTISANTLIISGSPIPQPSYKVYTALLTQTGTSAPTAIVLENTLGGDVVWDYDSPGHYLAILNGAFPDQYKFYTSLPFKPISLQRWSEIYWYGSNSFAVNTSEWNGTFPIIYQSQNDLLFDFPIEIRVYN